MPDSLPSTLVTAALAAEDRRFHYHGITFMLWGGHLLIITSGAGGIPSINHCHASGPPSESGGGWYQSHDAAAALGMTTVFGRGVSCVITSGLPPMATGSQVQPVHPDDTFTNLYRI